MSKMFDISKAQNKVYSLTHLHALLNANKLREAQEYIKTFFIRCGEPVGFALYNGVKNEFTFHRKVDLGIFLTSQPFNITIRQKIVNDDGIEEEQEKKIKFIASNYFDKGITDMYYCDFSLNEEKVFIKNGQYYINLYNRSKYNTDKLFSEYSERTKGKVEKVWQAFKTLWCSDDDKLFKYNKMWISTMLSGERCYTALYNRSPNGTGKGVMSSFLGGLVSGNNQDNGYKALESLEPFLEKFNACFENTLLLVVEEFECTSAEYKKLQGKLKYLITDQSLTIRKMRTDSVTRPNYLNIIINSNKNCVRLESTDRRWCVNDISIKHMQDHNYFKRLIRLLDNEKVRTAFYASAKEFYRNNKKSYNLASELKILVTKTKNEIKADRISDPLKYLKDYVKLEQDIDIPFNELYEDFKSRFKHTNISRNYFGTKLRELNIFKVYIRYDMEDGKRKKKTIYKCDYKTILKYLVDNQFITPDDDLYPEMEEIDISDSSSSEESVKPVIKKDKKSKKETKVKQTHENKNIEALLNLDADEISSDEE